MLSLVVELCGDDSEDDGDSLKMGDWVVEYDGSEGELMDGKDV